MCTVGMRASHFRHENVITAYGFDNWQSVAETLYNRALKRQMQRVDGGFVGRGVFGGSADWQSLRFAAEAGDYVLVLMVGGNIRRRELPRVV